MTSGALLWPLSLAVVFVSAGCGEPPSWQQLLAIKIHDQYPTYSAVPRPDGSLLVSRPGKPDAPVDVNAIALLCQRGPKDCNYATDQMLLDLGR